WLVMSEPNYKDEEARSKFYKSKEWRGKDGVRNKVLERDSYECVMCREQGRVTTQADETLEVDHIFELEHYHKLARHLDNLRTLCLRPCQNKRHDRFGNNQKESELSKKFPERW